MNKLHMEVEKLVRAFLFFLLVCAIALSVWGCAPRTQSNAGTAAVDRSAELNQEQAATLAKLGEHQDAAANAIDAASMTIEQLKEALGL